MKLDCGRSAVWRALATLLFVSLLGACGGGGGGGGGSSSSTGGGGTSGLPYLVVTQFSAPTSAQAGDEFNVTVTVMNQGDTPAYAVDAVVYLSPLPTISAEDGHIGLDVQLVTLSPGQSLTFSFTVGIPSNIATGSYTLGAVSLYTGEGFADSNRVSTRSIAITGTSCTPDAYEADNDIASARALTFGVPQTHNHCEGTRDWLRFDAVGGTTYTLSTSKVGSQGWTMVQVYNGDQTLLATGSPGLDFSDSRVTWTAPGFGTYYARVLPILGVHSAGANTEYDVVLGDVRPDLVSSSLWVSTTSAPPGGVVWLQDTVYNQGFANAGASAVGVYLSTDATITTADTLLGTRPVPALTIGDSNSSGTMAYSLPTNLALGTYYVGVVANHDGAINEYAPGNNASRGVAISVVTASCSADSYEPDDSASNAKPVTVGATAQSRNLCEDGLDWVRFDATVGSRYDVRSSGAGLTLNLYSDAILSNPSATPLASGSLALDWTAPATGTYYVAISGSMGAGRDYTFKVDPFRSDLTASINTVISSSAVAGGYLRVHDYITNIGPAASGAFEVGAYLSNDATVTTADMRLGTRAIANLNAQIGNEQWYNLHIPKDTPPGTYSLAAIADWAGAVTELREDNNVSAPVAVTLTTCAIDAYEDDETAATAKPITAGERQARNLCDDGVDWAVFTPTTDGAYYLKGTGFVAVYATDATTPVPLQAAYFYDQVSWRATAGSTYYIKTYTSDAQASGGGAYTLTLHQCAVDAYEDDDSAAAASPITVGQTQQRNHCEDGSDWAVFTASAGQNYTITSSNVGANATTRLVLYDATGQNIVTFGQQAQAGRGSHIRNWTAPASGTYYIKVESTFAWGPDSAYTLTLN